MFSTIHNQVLCIKANLPVCFLFHKADVSTVMKFRVVSTVRRDNGQSDRSLIKRDVGDENKIIKKTGKKEHHLWQRRDSAGSGHKAFNLVLKISKLPNDKETVYGALDEWVAWETEFPSVAAAKALRILRQRNQWKRLIQVAKWMLCKGQGATMATYDCLLLAYDMDARLDEAQTLWDVILLEHNRSISKRLFSRIISLYDHHNAADKVIEVFADMEELGVKPDQDTVRRIARAFKQLGQQDRERLFLKKYQSKWKYIHFKGERVRVRNSWDVISSSKDDLRT